MQNIIKSIYKTGLIFSFLALVPVVAFAQEPGPCDTGIGKIICKIQEILGSILPVLISLGVLYFVWGVVIYVVSDGEEAKKTGKDRMIFGIIGLAVIVGMWGLVNIITETFGLTGSVLDAPQLQPLTGSAANCTIDPATKPKFGDFLCYITGIINNAVIPLIFAVAVLMFIWGTIKFFIINSGEEKQRSEGKQFMIWGIVALAVMISIWGLVGILGDTFNLNTDFLPKVKEQSSS